jgi:hypothetical protein
MFSKKTLFAVSILILVFGICSFVLSQTPEKPADVPNTQPSTDVSQPAEPKPTPDSTNASSAVSLTEADYKLFGERMLASGKYMNKTYNAYSIVPGTWKWMGEEMEKGNAYSAVFIGVILLPFDLAFTRLYGGFLGPYYSGKVGDQFVSASKILPSQPASLMEMSGKRLKTGQTFGMLGNAAFYGGLTIALVQLYGSSNSSSDDLSNKPKSKSKPIAGLGTMALGTCLKLVSVQYTGSAGSKLEGVSVSFPGIEPFKAIGQAGKELRDYRTYSYWGTALMGAGIGMISAGKEGDLITPGIIAAIVGWVVASPVAVYNIKNAASKLQEAGDRMMFWKE